MEWEEFTSYVVDAGLNTSSAISTADRIDEYDRAKTFVSDASGSRRDFAVSNIGYLAELDQALVWERSQSQIRVIDGKSLRQVSSISGHKDQVFSAVFMAEHQWVATSSNDRRLCVWDPFKAYTKVRDIPTRHAHVVLSWYSEARRLFSVDDRQMVHVWNFDDVSSAQKPVHRFRSHRSDVLDMKVLSNLNLLATASLDATIGLFDVATHRRSHTLRGHDRGVMALAYQMSYHCIVSAGYDHKALIWDPYVDQSICALNGHYNPLVGVSVVEGTPQIITADVSGIVKIWGKSLYTSSKTLGLLPCPCFRYPQLCLRSDLFGERC